MTLHRASELKVGDQVRLTSSANALNGAMYDWNIVTARGFDDGDMFFRLYTLDYYFTCGDPDDDKPVWEVFEPASRNDGGVWITHAWHREILDRFQVIEQKGALDNERYCYLLGWQKAFKLTYEQRRAYLLRWSVKLGLDIREGEAVYGTLS